MINVRVIYENKRVTNINKIVSKVKIVILVTIFVSPIRTLLLTQLRPPLNTLEGKLPL